MAEALAVPVTAPVAEGYRIEHIPTKRVSELTWDSWIAAEIFVQTISPHSFHQYRVVPPAEGVSQ